MGILLSPFLGEFAFALALALAVAFVILVARFVGICVPLGFSLTFLVLPAFVALAVTRIEGPLLALLAEGLLQRLDLVVGGCFLLLEGVACGLQPPPLLRQVRFLLQCG